MKRKSIHCKTRISDAAAGLTFLMLTVFLFPSRGQKVTFKHTALPRATDLGVSGTGFTINGTPTFLYGVSYYAALGASEEFIRRDLADMRSNGFNWIRVWANWTEFNNDISAVDSIGRAREPFFSKLKWLVNECDRESIVVDLTLQRGYIEKGDPRLQTLDAYRSAVEALVTLLKPFHNWYLDLANEHDVRSQGFVTFDDLKDLRDAAKQIDPRLLITASSGYDISRDDLPQYLNTVRVDFISPHRPRNPASMRQTKTKTLAYLEWMKEIGRMVPVHYQEPFRRGFNDWQPNAGDYVTDLLNARAGGAAGWCFHNGNLIGVEQDRRRRSFDMRDKRLFDQLDSVELEAIEAMGKTLDK